MSINAQPFSPTFKLVGNLTADQILVYDASENAFVNATNSGASGSVGLSSVSNTGTGTGIGQQTGSALELKSAFTTRRNKERIKESYCRNKLNHNR